MTAQRGGKVSEDIVVPIERLAEAIEATLEIGVRHGVPACSWGHAGDGNLHSTFMIDLDDPAELQRAELAGHELFELAAGLRGSVSGSTGSAGSSAARSPLSGTAARSSSTRRSSACSTPRG